MNIIEMTGGLGNQMFQYALYLKYREKNIPVMLDTSFYTSEHNLHIMDHRDLQIRRFPHVQYEAAPERLTSQMRGYGYHDSILDKIHRKLCRDQKKVYLEDLDRGYQPEIFDLQDTYIRGYWQSEKYFQDIAVKVREAFTFPIDVTDNSDVDFRNLVSLMKGSQSVSIHVRRKDYLNPATSAIYGDICTLDYYHKAIDFMRQKLEDPVFFLFTDDVPWVRTHLMEQGMIMTSDMYVGNDLTDLYLMSRCRHHIIANSTYSWWGAWLMDNENKLVACPPKWFNNHPQTDMLCSNWNRIS